ncbi:methyltransferase, FxLD system [Actinomadura rayongensis]|uniref:Protein-L-isoaspartate O-methyltransferase n=1 Tax=Actinomadura rayongensis TaxID=1429076 RepID=A0A6I4WD67_9ACTN|nr:methyltransferase, FxLD system [Actinomadura rayongensis]MXQ65776.1 methyltransferase, FxLD system [Actinomadura rayongensis]
MSADDAAERARDRLVDRLLDEGAVESPVVEKALRAVPRHRFLPDAGVEEAYADRPVVVKRSAGGAPLSSASQPTIVASMLERLAVRPGDRVLEIGTGSGYTAALLRELTGADGEVTTVDVDPDLAAAARERLGAAATVVAADGAAGHAAGAPYDRIIVTTGAWDVPPAWWDQLADDGRIVVPLRWRGMTRSVALVRDGDRLVARSADACGFLPMRTADGERSLDLVADGRVRLVHDEDQAVGADALAAVLDRPRAETWSGVHVTGSDAVHAVWLRLAAAEPGTCALAARPAAIDGGLVSPALPGTSPAVVDGPSLAYLATRPAGPDLAELGAIGHDSGDLTDRMADQIALWHEAAPAPLLTVHRAGAEPPKPERGTVVRKRHTTLVLSW